MPRCKQAKSVGKSVHKQSFIALQTGMTVNSRAKTKPLCGQVRRYGDCFAGAAPLSRNCGDFIEEEAFLMCGTGAGAQSAATHRIAGPLNARK